MSATMFATTKPNEQYLDYSRIPISPTSPLPITRSNSLRLRGEKLRQYHHTRFSNNNVQSSTHRKKEEPRHDTTSSLAYCTRKSGCSTTQTTPVISTSNGNRLPDMRHLNSENTIEVVVNGCNHLKTDFRTTSTPKGGLTPHIPRTKNLSLSLSTTKIYNQKSPTISLPSTTPPSSPYGTNQSNLNHDWDLESVGSAASNLSLSSCDHAAIARNGTTFSGRSMRYIFHCNQNTGLSAEEYLTPTQRAHRQIKKLKGLLHQAQLELDQKDSDILKLTKEVVELRLYKAAICSPEDGSNSSDAVTVKENNSDEQITPESVNGVENKANCSDSNGSHVDSGHFEDLDQHDSSKRNSSDLQYGAIGYLKTSEKSVETCNLIDVITSSEQRVILEYQKKIQELIKVHEEECIQMKQKQNEKIEELLARIGDYSQRYWQLVPELEAAKERIKDLEKQLDESCKKLEELENKHEEVHKEITDAAQGTSKSGLDTQVMDIAQRNPSRLSVPELLKELQVTKNELDNLKDTEYASTSNNLQPLLSAKEALSLWVLGARKAMYRQLVEAKNRNKIDPEITLQFLKSAIYYFLTDKENTAGHLRAIQSILGFNQSEISNIDKAQLQ